MLCFLRITVNTRPALAEFTYVDGDAKYHNRYQPTMYVLFTSVLDLLDVDVQGREHGDIHGGVGGGRGVGLHVVRDHEMHLHHSLLVILSHPGGKGPQHRGCHRDLHSFVQIKKKVSHTRAVRICNVYCSTAQ